MLLLLWLLKTLRPLIPGFQDPCQYSGLRVETGLSPTAVRVESTFRLSILVPLQDLTPRSLSPSKVEETASAVASQLEYVTIPAQLQNASS